MSTLQDPDAIAQEVKSCFVKVRYSNDKQANVARIRNLKVFGAQQQIYHCNWCQGYHLTTVNRRRF